MRTKSVRADCTGSKIGLSSTKLDYPQYLNKLSNQVVCLKELSGMDEILLKLYRNIKTGAKKLRMFHATQKEW